MVFINETFQPTPTDNLVRGKMLETLRYRMTAALVYAGFTTKQINEYAVSKQYAEQVWDYIAEEMIAISQKKYEAAKESELAIVVQSPKPTKPPKPPKVEKVKRIPLDQKIFQLIHTLAESGMSNPQIAAKLNESGYRTERSLEWTKYNLQKTRAKYDKT